MPVQTKRSAQGHIGEDKSILLRQAGTERARLGAVGDGSLEQCDEPRQAVVLFVCLYFEVAATRLSIWVCLSQIQCTTRLLPACVQQRWRQEVVEQATPGQGRRTSHGFSLPSDAGLCTYCGFECCGVRMQEIALQGSCTVITAYVATPVLAHVNTPVLVHGIDASEIGDGKEQHRIVLAAAASGMHIMRTT